MIPQGELLVDDAPHDCLNSQVHHILPTPTHQGLVGCMEVEKWLKYIVKKGISTQEILLFLIDPRSSSCYMPPPATSPLRSARNCTQFFLFYLLHNLPKLEILYYDAVTTSITEGRMRFRPEVSVKSVICIFATLCC